MRKRINASVEKEVGLPATNEDGFLWLLREYRALMLDGASDSYAARTWVNCVREAWRTQPRGVDFLQIAQEQYSKRVKKPDHWAMEQAFERGSYCTFLEVCVDYRRQTVDIRAIGDTCVLALSDSSNVVWAYPFDSASQFDSAPFALSSDPTTLRKQHQLLLEATYSVPISRGPIAYLILATDAVAAWLLDDDPSIRADRVHEIMSLNHKQEFRRLVARERKSRAMHVDDSTIAVVSVGGTT